MVRAAALAIFLLIGCASQPQVIPMFTRVPAPAALTAPVAPPKGEEVFILPTDERAVVGLTAAGKDRLVRYVDELAKRLEAWRAWAAE